MDDNGPPRAFCAVFAILGFLQLFVASKPVTIASIAVSAAVSAAAASAIGDADGFSGLAARVQLGCGDVDGPVTEEDPPPTLTRALLRCALRAAAPVLPFLAQP